MRRVNAIEHHVYDFEGEVRFFREVLGWPENLYIADRLASFKVDDAFAVLVIPRDPTHPAYTNLKGETLDISVDLSEVDELYEQIKGKGAPVRISPVTNPAGVRSFYFETPGGLTIEYETATTDAGAQTLKRVFGQP